MNKRAVTCFINSLAGGGAEHQLIILANFLAERGYDVTFLTYNTSDYGQYKLSSRVIHKNIKTHGGRIRKFFDVFRYLYNHQTECFISYRAPVNTILLLPMFFRRNVKCIVGERNLTVGRPSIYERFNFNLLYRRADYIVPNSESQTNYILTKKPAYKNKILTIRNYTEIDKYYPIESPEKRVKVVGVFCRYDPQKNYINLAKALKILKDDGFCDFVFKWFGKAFYSGEKVNEHYLNFQNAIKSFGIEKLIELHDITTDIPKEMKNIDVVCLPSLYEGFSNSLSEAICCGKPVIASNISDNSTMVKDGVNGFLFDPKSPDDIANAIRNILSLSVEERLEMSKASRIIAEKIFDKERFVNSYISLIEN